MKTITVNLDERPLELPAGSTLADLLRHEQLAPDGAATACNGHFVPRECRAGTVLQDGDQVLLFKPIVGG
ncbi:MAG TPA: sulfur carrier protein ThiS [Methylibium sp.]